MFNFLTRKRHTTKNGFDYGKFITRMKKEKKGLMSKKQYLKIAEALSNKGSCSLLVFGLGEDSFLWRSINEEGRTVFLEDSEDWIKEFDGSGLDIRLVSYTTFVGDHELIGFDISKLHLDLPADIGSARWDFIIVDAPLGHQPPREYKGPGRMASIYNASKLLKDGGVAVVDDMGRPVERKYAFHFFGKENMESLIEGKVAIFRVGEHHGKNR